MTRRRTKPRDPGAREAPAHPRLERELLETRRELSATAERLGTANEALQASNEELRVSNEELQLANEELRASREELHVANAELEAVNGELRGKVDALARAEGEARRLARLLEVAHEAILVWRLDGALEYWNRGAEELYGWTAREAVGQRSHDLLATRFPVPFPRLQAELRAAGRWTGELVHRTRSGQLVTVLASMQLVRAEDGGLEVLEANRDIGDRIAAETALREEGRRKNEFLAVLSHELRNPLAPIRNSIYLLERAPPGGEQARRALAILTRQVAQLGRLVDDLLDVTRIERNKIELRRERLDVGELVRKTVEDHATLFSTRNLALSLEGPDAPLQVRGDPHRLAQVVGNLLHNAAKFTPGGGSVRVRVGADGAARAVIRVADTGAGMTAETMSRLFQPFMQAEATLDRTRGGLGLGLALVKALVELHGGEVTARSEGPGRGAELTVTLPLADEAAAPAREAPRAAPRPRRVLVVDDNVDGADTLRELLAAWGHEVRVAYDGDAAVEAARRWRPELVLCDVGLPGKDGYAVASTLRADPELRALRLVALSGYASPDDVRRALAAGFDHHLAKPPPLDRLAELLAGA